MTTKTILIKHMKPGSAAKWATVKWSHHRIPDKWNLKN